MARDSARERLGEKQSEILEPKVRKIKEDVDEIEDTVGKAYSKGILIASKLHEDDPPSSGPSIISSGIALVIGIIVLVGVTNFMSGSLGFSLMNTNVLGGMTSTITTFITVGIAVGLFAAAFQLTNH